jgi:hypothetical protein
MTHKILSHGAQPIGAFERPCPRDGCSNPREPGLGICAEHRREKDRARKAAKKARTP